MKNTGFEFPSFENIVKIRGPSKTQLFFNKSTTIENFEKTFVSGLGTITTLGRSFES